MKGSAQARTRVSPNVLGGSGGDGMGWDGIEWRGVRWDGIAWRGYQKRKILNVVTGELKTNFYLPLGTEERPGPKVKTFLRSVFFKFLPLPAAASQALRISLSQFNAGGQTV